MGQSFGSRGINSSISNGVGLGRPGLFIHFYKILSISYYKSLIIALFYNVILCTPAMAGGLIDGQGHSVDPTVLPRRIASCSLASDEVLLALLGRAHHLDRLVAVSTLADDHHFSNIEKVPGGIAGRCGSDVEALLKTRPDLAILASFNRPEIQERLHGAKVRTFVLASFATLEDIEANVVTLGKLAHIEPEALALRAEFHAARTKIQAHPPAKRLVVLQYVPGGSVSGKDTLFDALVRDAGGINAAAALGLKGWPMLSTEVLAGLKPDLIVTGGQENEREKILATLRTTPGWKDLPAVRNGQLLVIPENQISATSPYIISALSALHAELVRLAAAPGGKAP